MLIKCLRFWTANLGRRTLCNQERKMKHPFFRWPHLLFAIKRTPILISRTNSFLLCIAMVSYFQRALLTQSFYICLRFMLLWTPNDVGRLKSDFQHNKIFEANEISRATATAAAVFSCPNESILHFFIHIHIRVGEKSKEDKEIIREWVIFLLLRILWFRSTFHLLIDSIDADGGRWWLGRLQRAKTHSRT